MCHQPVTQSCITQALEWLIWAGMKNTGWCLKRASSKAIWSSCAAALVLPPTLISCWKLKTRWAWGLRIQSSWRGRLCRRSTTASKGHRPAWNRSTTWARIWKWCADRHLRSWTTCIRVCCKRQLQENRRLWKRKWPGRSNSSSGIQRCKRTRGAWQWEWRSPRCFWKGSRRLSIVLYRHRCRQAQASLCSQTISSWMVSAWVFYEQLWSCLCLPACMESNKTDSASKSIL